MRRLFLDANVLFTAAHNPGGKAALVVEAAQCGHWRLVSSNYAVEEARRNLGRKFPGRLAELERLLVHVEVAATVRQIASSPPLPEKDHPIFATAVAGRATHLLTGDIRDFGPCMKAPAKTGGVVIQTIAAFLRQLEQADPGERKPR